MIGRWNKKSAQHRADVEMACPSHWFLVVLWLPVLALSASLSSCGGSNEPGNAPEVEVTEPYSEAYSRREVVHYDDPQTGRPCRRVSLYYPDGKLAVVDEMTINNVFLNQWMWHRNGQMSVSMMWDWKSGRGVHRRWHENGQLAMHVENAWQISSGIADGPVTEWDEAGNLLRTGKNAMGEKVGIWYERQPDGTLTTVDYGR